MRSPSAADIVAAWDGYAADFAGLSNDADEQLSSEQIAWADVIMVMEARQKKRLMSLFGQALRTKRIVVLNVPDRFEYMDPALVALLTPKLKQVLRKGT